MCSILCWILSIWEALGFCMFSFGLIHALPTRGRIVSPIHNMGWDALCITRGRVLHHEGENEGYSVQGENLSLHAFVQEELAFIYGEFFVSPDIALCFALLPMVSSPFSSPWGVDILSVLSRLCWAVALALGDRDLLSQVILFWLFFGFWSLVWVRCSFLFFFFFYELVTMCVFNALIKGEIEDRSDRGPVDGRSLLWWLINNVVWTDSWPSIAGAGCGLTCVGAGEERARKVLACVAFEEWRDK
jgi:hypothetical protein